MAGSSSNWFKAPAGMKGRLFVSNKTIAPLFDSVAEGKRLLAEDPVEHDLELLSRWSVQPGGQAKKKLSATPKERTIAVSGKNSMAMAAKILGVDRDVTPEEIADLVGAPDGADVKIRSNAVSKKGIWIEVSHPSYTATRVIEAAGGGPRIYNWVLEAKPGAPSGIGARLVWAQMTAAAKMGIDTVYMEAAEGAYEREDGETGHYNGYYTWPRMGFNGYIPPHLKGSMPPGLADSGDLLDLFSRPGGPEWWKKHGISVNVSFDPTPGSRNWQALQDYLDIKGIDPGAPWP